jgi:hypothetical protein
MRRNSAIKVVKSRRTLVWIACGLMLNSLFAQTDRSTTTPKIDAALAAYFDVHSTAPNIEEQITDATKAGQKPKEVVITKSWVEKFVDHAPYISRRTGIPPLVGTAIANSDLVVMATVEGFHSLPNKNHSFLFTEYTVRVNRVFLDKSRVVAAGDTILVSREGGSFELDNVVVKAVEPAFDRFSLHQPYIFALKTIPGTGTYRATAPSTFVIADGLVSSASKLEARTERNKSLSDFSSDLEAAVAQKR